MQPPPRPHAHRAVLLILDGQVASGGGPGGWDITGELVAVATWPPGPRRRSGVGIEAAPGAQAHQDSGASVS